MARKRGGLAGLWDSKKGVIKTAVPAALSFIPGAGIPLAAGSRALMEGLDREGKSGIGFDPFKGLEGGAKGAAIGAGTQGARALLTGGGPMSGMVPKIGGGAAKAATQEPRKLISPLGSLLTGDGGASAVQQGAKMSFGQALKNPQVLSTAISTGIGMLPGPESEAARMNADVAQQRVDLEKRKLEMDEEDRKREQERRRMIAELLMPYAQGVYSSLGAR